MPARILVVDDSVTIRHVVTTILKRNGYFATEAVDGQEALDFLSSGEMKIDLVLLDFVMPRMNGFQFCRAIRQKTELCMTPVVLMSAKSDRIREQFVQQTGAVDALTKPFDADALLLVVENALRKLEGGRASSSRLLDFDDVDESKTGMSDIPPELGDPKEVLMARLGSALDQAGVGRDFSDALAKPKTARELSWVLDRLDSLSSEKRGERLLAGDLKRIPIGAVLQTFQVEGLTGVLTAESAGSQVSVTFRQGLIDLVESKGARDEFRLGRYFIEEGLVSPRQIDDVLGKALPVNEEEAEKADELETAKTASTPSIPAASGSDTDLTSVGDEPVSGTIEMRAPMGMRLGDRLVAEGLIDLTQLNNALVRQSSELIYELLRWPSGVFEFRATPPSRNAEKARLGLPVAAVVMEGFRRVDEWRLLETSLGNFDSVLLRDEAMIDQMGREGLPRQESVVLEAVDGVRTIRDVVQASHLSSFDACRTLAQFLEARLVRRRVA